MIWERQHGILHKSVVYYTGTECFTLFMKKYFLCVIVFIPSSVSLSNNSSPFCIAISLPCFSWTLFKKCWKKLKDLWFDINWLEVCFDTLSLHFIQWWWKCCISICKLQDETAVGPTSLMLFMRDERQFLDCCRKKLLLHSSPLDYFYV